MTLAEACAWIAPVMSLMSLYYYGRKHITGPIIGVLSQLPWTFIAYDKALLGMAASSLVFGALHVNCIWKWTRST